MKTISIISMGLGLILSIGAILDPILKGSNHLIVPMFIAGMFFILLSLLNEKNNEKNSGSYISITIALFCFLLSYLGITTGKVSIGKHSPYTYQETEPDKFWLIIIIYLVIGILFTIHSYWLFRKLQKQRTTQMGGSNEAIMKDLDLAGKLLTETKTARELKEKSDLLFTYLESKYKSNVIAQPAIQASKDFIKEEIEKRKLHEQRFVIP